MWSTIPLTAVYIGALKVSCRGTVSNTVASRPAILWRQQTLFALYRRV